MITCEIDYKHKLIGKQSISLVLNPSIYKSQICPARTFGFLEDVEKLREMNLALGGSLDNAIVLDKNKILNKDGLRFSDEFVRHKVRFHRRYFTLYRILDLSSPHIADMISILNFSIKFLILKKTGNLSVLINLITLYK